jgi:hypothetical protein
VGVVEPEGERAAPEQHAFEQAPQLGRARDAGWRFQERVAGEVIGGDLAPDERLVQCGQGAPIVVGLVEPAVLGLDHADAGDRNARRVAPQIVCLALEDARSERVQQRGLADARRADQQHQERRSRIGQHLAQLSVDTGERRMRDTIRHEALEALPLLGGQPRERVRLGSVNAGLAHHQQ